MEVIYEKVCLTFALMFTLSAPAFAMNQNINKYDDSVTVYVNEKPVSIRYHVEDNYITYAEIENDIVTVQDNVVFLNGIKIATILSTISDFTEKNIEPRTGWIYSNSCPSGVSPSDYDTLSSTQTHNITFE